MGIVYQVCHWYATGMCMGMCMGMVWIHIKARHVARFGQKSLDCYGCIDPRSTWLATLPRYLNLCLGMHTI